MARPRSTEARTKTLTAAADLLGEGGVAAFSVEEVARRSGVAKTTIYRNWATADELLHDALNSLVQPEEQPDTGSLRGDLRAMVGILMEQSDEERARLRRIFSGLFAASFDDERLADLYRRVLVNRCAPIGNVMERARQRGELPPDVDDDVAVDLLVGPIVFRILLRDELFTDNQLTALVDYILKGLTAAGRTDS